MLLCSTQKTEPVALLHHLSIFEVGPYEHLIWTKYTVGGWGAIQWGFGSSSHGNRESSHHVSPAWSCPSGLLSLLWEVTACWALVCKAGYSYIIDTGREVIRKDKIRSWLTDKQGDRMGLGIDTGVESGDNGQIMSTKSLDMCPTDELLSNVTVNGGCPYYNCPHCRSTGFCLNKTVSFKTHTP